METPVAHHETLPNLDFMEVDAIAELRHEQELAKQYAMDEVYDHYDTIIGNHPNVGRKPSYYADPEAVEDEAHAAGEAAVRHTYQGYLDYYAPFDETDPALYDELGHLLAETSIDNMTDEEWQIGPPDENGRHTRQSGKEYLEDELDKIHSDAEPDEYEDYDNDDDEDFDDYEDDEEEEDDDDELTDEDLHDYDSFSVEERERRQAALDESRTRYARLKYETSRLSGERGRKARKLLAQYEVAEQEYRKAATEYGVIEATDLRHQGYAASEILAHVTAETVLELKRISQEEHDFMEFDDRLRSRFAKWFAKGHRLEVAMGAFGLTTGAASKFAIAGVAGAVAPPIGAALVGGVVAARTAGAVMAAQVGNAARNIRSFDERHDQDVDNLEANLSLISPVGHPDTYHQVVVNHATKHLIDVIGERGVTDRGNNKRRKYTMAAIAGGSALAGVFLEMGVEHIPAVSSALDKIPGHHAIGGQHVDAAKAPTGTGHGALGTQPGGVGNHGAPGASAHGTHSGTNGGSHGGSHGNTHSGSSNHGGNAETGNRAVDGYNTHVTIDKGTGFQHALHELAGQKHIDLTDQQSWDLYQHLNDKFHGNFFTNNEGYGMGNGNYGISHTGGSNWDPRVVHAMNEWMQQHAGELHSSN
jgi:hypothetical protein